MEFQDRVLRCVACHQDFIFTAGEQEFYERKGFKEIPKRCKPCREARKARMAEANGHGHPGPLAGGNGHADPPRPAAAGRPVREMFDGVCVSCGAQARVPFRPVAGRPIYCHACYICRQSQGSSC
ncbi:MAG: zinc-ribbon domain containing protein [Myxococcales bacterium]|nr:zinc-ribbon domain containing protein [Myxococcales bacterium]